MSESTPAPSAAQPPTEDALDPRVAAGLADLAAAAADLRPLVRDEAEPELGFDATWPTEAEQ